MPEITVVQLKQYGLVAIGVVLILILGWIAARMLRGSLRRITARGYITEPLRHILDLAVRWTLIVLVVLLSLQQVGVPVASVWAAVSAVVVAIAVGFVAVWSILSNILSAVMLIIFGPFRIGDEVEVIEPVGGDGLRGRVIGLNLLYTTLEEITSEGETVTVQIPNNIFFQKPVRRRKGTNTKTLDTMLFRETGSS